MSEPAARRQTADLYRDFVEQPIDPPTALALASHYTNERRYAEALPYIETALAAPHLRDVLELRQIRAAVLAELGSLDAAIVEYQALIGVVPNEPYLLARLGHLLGRVGRSDEAVPPLLRAAGLAPTIPAYRFDLAQQLRASGRLDIALAHYEEAVALAPKEESYRLHLAAALARLGRSDRALEIMRDYTKLLQHPRPVWRRYFPLALETGQIGHVEAVHGEVEAAGGADATAWHGLAFLYEQADRLEEGLEAIEKALGLDRKQHAYHGLAGILLSRLGRGPEAERALAVALELGEDQAQYRRGFLDHLDRLVGLEESIESVERAMDFAPSSDFLREVLDDLRRRREAAQSTMVPEKQVSANSRPADPIEPAPASPPKRSRRRS